MARMAILLLPLLLAVPSAERCAAMLLSPNPEVRKAGRDALAEVDAAAVLKILAERAHARGDWVAALEKELPDSQGLRHKEIRDLLAILQDSTEDNVGVDLVILSVPRPAARALLGKGLPAIAHRDGAAWEGWWATIATVKGAEQLFKASLPGKDAHTVAVEQKRKISYVKDFEVRGNIGSPVVAELEAGLFLKWRPTVARDGAHVTIDFDMTVRDVVRPIATQEKTVGKLKVRIQVPERTETHDRTSLTLRLGGCGAYLFPRKGDDALLVFARARLGAPQGTPDLPLPERDIGIVER